MIMTQTYMSLRAATGQAPSSQPPSTCRNQNMLLRPVPRTEDTAAQAPLAAAEKSLETVKEWPGDEAECGRGVQSSCSSAPASCSDDGEVLVQRDKEVDFRLEEEAEEDSNLKPEYSSVYSIFVNWTFVI